MTDEATVETLEARATAATLTLLRLEVAEAKKIPTDQAKRLRGATRSELEADADQFLAEVAAARRGKSKRPLLPPERMPREKLRPGSNPEPEANDLVTILRRALS